MHREPHKLTTADRAELCRRVDLPALLAAQGVEVKRNGRAFLCKLRDERTPSCHVYPPDVGRKGAAGWTMKDYGDGWGGDALAYLQDKRGLAFPDAVAELCARANWTPPSWNMEHAGQSPRRSANGAANTNTAPTLPTAQACPQMPTDAQAAAVAVFLAELVNLCPTAAAEGEAYLVKRGCRPPGWTTGAWVLPAEACKPLTARLAAGPDLELLTRAGLLKPAEDEKPRRLAWWDRVALLTCQDAKGAPVYLVGRRLDWTEGDRFGKYVNQACAGGAVRWPFNVPALYARPDELLLVEGPLDALGAAVLGRNAVALLTRLQVHDYADRDGAAAKMLEAHLPALRDVRRVRVVPDADPGEKGAAGEAMAAKLAAWLTFAGVRAEVATLPELGAPPAWEAKDLADWALATIL